MHNPPEIDDGKLGENFYLIRKRNNNNNKHKNNRKGALFSKAD